MHLAQLLTQASHEREQRAERTINGLRLGGTAAAVLLDGASVLSNGMLTVGLMLTTVAMMAVMGVWLWVVNRLSRGVYRPWLKYLTVGLDHAVAMGVFWVGVEHAQLLRMSPDALRMYMVVWLVLVNLLCAFRHGRLVALYSSTLAAVVITLMAMLVAWNWQNVIYPLLFVALSGTMVVLLSESQERMHVSLVRKQQMMRFLSREVVEQFEAGALEMELGGVKRRVTILLSDIRGFTAFSEDRDPLEVVSLLNEYFTEMTRVVFRHGGVVDKFMGDAVLAVFGSPVAHADDAQRALKTALDMHQALQTLNARWQGRGAPLLHIGVALHTGDVVAGNIGSPERMEYTVIGDTVNVASRLESLNKTHGTWMLLSETTLAALGQTPGVRDVGSTEVRGRHQSVRLYTVDAPDGANAAPVV